LAALLRQASPKTITGLARIEALRLRVRKPYADAINYGKIYTKVNGESSGVIQTPGEIATTRSW
jgi:hypothetical protein